MLHLVLAEAALETIPREIWKHPAVRKYAKKRGKPPALLLLDLSFHYAAAKKLPDIEKRGRPDIVHLSLLEALGSPLNKAGKLRVYVHTYGDQIIRVNPETRLPRNYYRFVGLIEQLYATKKVPPESETPLLTLEQGSLVKLVGDISPSKIFLMSEDGEPADLLSLARELTSTPKPLVIVGAFQRGDFRPQTRKLADRVISIYPESLDSWVVVSRVIAAYEIGIGLYERTLTRQKGDV